MGIRRDLIERVWHGIDPFVDYPSTRAEPDLQGWGSGHPYLTEAVDRFKPQITVEIGVWKGGSVATLANAVRTHKIDGAVIAVDTWLGSSEHWLINELYPLMEIKNGLPRLYDKFMNNMLSLSLEDIVIPLPVDSTNASIILSSKEIQADMIHLDAGHDYDAVYNDLQHWWPLLKQGGLLIGDDYSEGWPGVVRAFDTFFAERGIHYLENNSNKCRIVKSSAA